MTEGRLRPPTHFPAIESSYQQSRSADAVPIPAVVRANRAAALAIAAARRHDLTGAEQHRAELKSAHEQEAELAPRYFARGQKVRLGPRWDHPLS